MKSDTNISADIGSKAKSLMSLADIGLFEDNLLIVSENLEKEELVSRLEKAGFKDSDEFSVRTSHPDIKVHTPRKGCTGFSQVYDFYHTTKGQGYTFVIHTFQHGRYGGVVSLINDELTMEITEGDWNIDYAINTDTAIFADGVCTWYLYKEQRRVPYIVGSEVKEKSTDPISEKDAKSIFKEVVKKIDKLKQLLSGDYNSLELLITDDFKIKPLELRNIDINGDGMKDIEGAGIFEIVVPADLRKWDRKTPLLISIPTSVDRADGLMSVIKEIKDHTDFVYISYGVLSHPAILLREAGISVERRISNFRTVKFSY